MWASTSLAACSLLTPLGDLAGTAVPDGALDGSSADRFAPGVEGGDATEPIDGTTERMLDAPSGGGDNDAGADAAPPELHPNGTFESGLAPWVPYHGTVASDTTARTGTHSLRTCAQASVPSDSVFSADDSGAVLGPVVGATYHASAWVRTAPGATAAPRSVNLLFRTIDTSPAFAEVENSYTPSIAMSTTWTKLETDLKVTTAAQALNVAVTGHYEAGACFLIDDVSVVRLP